MPRSDAYVEHVDYRDTGCNLAPRCLECPLERCQFDVVERRGPRASVVAVAQELSRSANVDYLVASTGYSRRTVYRAMRELLPR